jgi:hypothetical protein
VSQEWLIKFVEHRVGDRRIIRLIQKWLKAGVLEDGIVTVSDKATGQGSVISPLLANLYLHYVFSLLRKVPDLVRRIPGHRPARSARRVRATCRRCAVPARRGPARMTDRTIELRPRHDSSMVAMREGGERKCEVQSLSFFAFQVPSSIRGVAFAGPCWSGLAVDKQKLLFQTQALTGDLIQQGCELSGVDSAPQMIGMCKAQFSDCDWHVADIRRCYGNGRPE